MGINKIKDRQKLQNGWNNADLDNENLRRKIPNIEEAMNASNFNFDDDEDRG